VSPAEAFTDIANVPRSIDRPWPGRRMTGAADASGMRGRCHFQPGAGRPRLPNVNIRSIVAPTLSRYPTEYQWEELEELLRRAVSQMPRQTLPEALGEEPARSVIDEWRHRHWLDESASYLP
jgi:hypothetical protein